MENQVIETPIKYPDRSVFFLLTRTAVMLAALLCLTSCATIEGQNSLAGEESEFDDDADIPTIAELIIKGDSAFNSGDMDAAQVSYALAVEQDPNNVDALYKLGFIHNEKESLTVAQSVLYHALRVDPSHLASKQTLALVLLKQQRIEQAEKLFSELVDINPSGWEAFNGLGVVMDMQGKHSDAQALFQQALRLNPRSAQVANNLGFSLYLEERYPEAEDAYRQALHFDSAYERAWSNLALLYSRDGRYRDASVAFRKIVSEHQAANNLGYLGILAGNNSLARVQLARAVALSPSYYELANRNMEALDSKTTSLNKMSVLKVPRGNTSTRLVAPVSGGVPIVRLSGRDAGPESAPVPAALELIKTNNKSNPKNRRLTTSSIQHYLNFLGFKAGSADGKFGNQTRKSIIRFQVAHKLDVDGRVGRRTGNLLYRQVVTAVQNNLTMLGFNPGVNDGRLGRKTSQAISEFQRKSGLRKTGTIDGSLLVYLTEARNQIINGLNDEDFPDLSSQG